MGTSNQLRSKNQESSSSFVEINNSPGGRLYPDLSSLQMSQHSSSNPAPQTTIAIDMGGQKFTLSRSLSNMSAEVEPKTNPVANINQLEVNTSLQQVFVSGELKQSFSIMFFAAFCAISISIWELTRISMKRDAFLARLRLSGANSHNLFESEFEADLANQKMRHLRVAMALISTLIIFLCRLEKRFGRTKCYLYLMGLCAIAMVIFSGHLIRTAIVVDAGWAVVWNDAITFFTYFMALLEALIQLAIFIMKSPK